MVYAAARGRAAVDVCGLLGRSAAARALAVRAEWVNTALLALGMFAGFCLAVDHWVHRRETGEVTLATAVKNVKKQIEDGRSIWDRSVEIGHTVQALQTMVVEVKEILDRMMARDDRQRERFGEMKEQLARMEEHFKSIDREVVTLRAEVKDLSRLRGQ